MTSVPEPTFAQYRRLRPPAARDLARSVALSALASAAQIRGAIDRALARPRVQFIYLHHVFVDEGSAFRRLLASLAEQHTFIGHGEAIERVRSGRIDRPYVSVSFDDGFADNLRAASMLEEFGARGCFFVCPGIVGEGDPARLEAFCATRLEFPTATPFMGWDDLERLKARGHEIGGHTMTHPNIADVPAAEARAEIEQSFGVLKTRLGDVRHFAWPRGRWSNFTREAREAVFAAGFESCASAVRGCHVVASPGAARDLCIRRDHVVAAWPLAHARYLLMRNSTEASAADNDWPAALS